jgi:hypothetical protein
MAPFFHGSKVPGFHGLVLIGFAVLTIGMTWPLLSPAAKVLPDNDDAYFSVWRLAWFAHQLPRDPWHLFDANIFHPATGTLAFSDAMLLVSAIGAAAIWLGVGAATVHNLLLGAAFVSSMWFAFLLVRDLTRSAAAAWIAAIILGFAPYRFAHIGHLELQWLMWMPLSLWLLHRLVAMPTAGRALALGSAVACQALSSIYYGVFLTLYLCVAMAALIPSAGRGRRRTLMVAPLVAVPLVVAGLIYGPPYLYSRQQHGARSTSEIVEYSATPADFLRVPPNNRLRGSSNSGLAPEERSLFPGTVAVVLAAAAFVPPVAPPAWMYLGLTAVSVDAALGMNGLLFPLLQRVAPPLTSLRSPARFGALLLLSIAVLAGLGVARMTRARPQSAGWLVAAATLCCLVEYWSGPIRVRPNLQSPTEAHRFLSSQPAGTVVLEMPVPRNDALWLYETTHLIRSIHHWQPLVNGYSGFAPEEYRRTLETLRGFPDDRSIERLRELNVRFILLNRVYYTGEEFTDLIARATASPALSPSTALGAGDEQIVIVELKR